MSGRNPDVQSSASLLSVADLSALRDAGMGNMVKGRGPGWSAILRGQDERMWRRDDELVWMVVCCAIDRWECVGGLSQRRRIC